MAERGERLVTAATYMPAAVGPYLWHEFDPGSVENDLRGLRASGIETVRVLLAWDAFVPHHRQVSRARIRALETLLRIAAALSLRVVPVLFAQSLGDTIMLPDYAIDRAVSRRGVRVVCDGSVRDGGPRDMWTDPLMLEVQQLWLETMLDAFANHPAIAAWDLGHDPAACLRPRRIADMQAWTRTHADRIHAAGDTCWMTLDADDILSARGVRLGAVAPSVDALGMILIPQRLALARAGTLEGAAVFTLQLAQRLAGREVRLLVHTGLATVGDDDEGRAVGDRVSPRWDVELLDDERAPPLASDLLDRVVDAGMAGVVAASWSDWGPRPLAAPPADRRPSLARLGLVGTRGDYKPHGERWAAWARREPASAPAQPWPDHLDVEEYYANLPDSARQLYAEWRGGHDDHPGILN